MVVQDLAQLAQRIPLIPVEELARRRRRTDSQYPELWSALDGVMDPEIPVISLYELGVLQDVVMLDDRVKLVRLLRRVLRCV